jgi:outer membrane lipase/esterase
MGDGTKRLSAAACGLSVALLAGAAAAQSQYSSITVFGDSLSDPGNIPKFFGFNYPGPPYYENQFSNGPIYAKYLDGLFGISTPLQDYAIGGAKTGVGNIGGLPGNPTIGLPNAGIDGELSYYLASNPRPGGNSLFIVWGGANDYFGDFPAVEAQGLSGAALKSYLTGPTGPVTMTVSNIMADITRLARIGVKNFVVPNLPDLGATPSYNGDPTTAQEGAAITNAHNQALAQALGQLQRRLHVNITIVDIGAVFSDIVANPAKYGIDPAHTADECLLSPACVANHQHYLFWDDVHPTGFVQQQLAELFFSSLDGPTTVGPEMELNRVVQQDLFDHISARTAALRLGVAGLTIDGAAGSRTLADTDKPLAAFVTDSYGWGSRDASQSTAGFDYRRNATSAGLDYRLNDWTAVGGMIGYSQANDTLANDLGSQSFSSYQAAIYATAYADGWYGSVAGTYAYDDWNKLNRNVFVGGQTARASTDGHVLGAKLEGGYVLTSGPWSFGPEAELRLADYRIGGYTEQGAVGVNQEVDGQGLTSMVGQFGVEAALATAIGAYAVVPRLSVAFDHEFHGGTRAIVTRIASQAATSVTTDIGPGATDWARLDAGVDVKVTEIFSALVDFDSTVGRSGGEDYNALARLRANF